ncbi:MAG: hypothetical protein LC101_03895 [Flavobacteriales bacterium]|nr:hypothetical protein [Flavobacteriales bacterium]
MRRRPIFIPVLGYNIKPMAMVYDTYVYDSRGRIAVVGSLNGRQNTSYQYDFSHIPNKITTTRSYNDILIPDHVFVEQFDGFGKSIFKKRNAIRLSEAKYDGMFRPITPSI